MKKLLVIAVLGGLGYGAYRYFHKTPEKRACAKMASLCGDNKADIDRCERDFADLAKTATPETMAKLDSCVSDAKTCAEGMGCVVGTGVNAFGDALNQFMKGVGNAAK